MLRIRGRGVQETILAWGKNPTARGSTNRIVKLLKSTIQHFGFEHILGLTAKVVPVSSYATWIPGHSG